MIKPEINEVKEIALANIKVFFTYWKLLTIFEIIYVSRKYKIKTIWTTAILSVAAIALSYNDTSSFITDHLIPNISFLSPIKSKRLIVIGITTFIILVSSGGSIIGSIGENQEVKELKSISKSFIIPKINKDMESWLSEMQKKHKLGNKIRISLFIPIRLGLFKWRLKMIHTLKNSPLEKEAELRINEGAIGYSLMMNDNIGCVLVDISSSKTLPGYKGLKKKNIQVLSPAIKIVVAAVCRKSGPAGLLAIDTSDVNLLPILNDADLMQECSQFITDQYDAIRLIWRAENGI